MSRKDYCAIANVIAGEVALAENDGADHTVSTLENVARSVADVFAADNPRFDRQRFYTAAGIR